MREFKAQHILGFSFPAISCLQTKKLGLTVIHCSVDQISVNLLVQTWAISLTITEIYDNSYSYFMLPPCCAFI